MGVTRDSGVTNQASSASSFNGRGEPSHVDGNPSMANGGYGAALHRASLDVAQLNPGNEKSHIQADPPLEHGSDEWAAHEPATKV